MEKCVPIVAAVEFAEHAPCCCCYGRDKVAMRVGGKLILGESRLGFWKGFVFALVRKTELAQ